jgi:hypothetical protein
VPDPEGVSAGAAWVVTWEASLCIKVGSLGNAELIAVTSGSLVEVDSVGSWVAVTESEYT